MSRVGIRHIRLVGWLLSLLLIATVDVVARDDNGKLSKKSETAEVSTTPLQQRFDYYYYAGLRAYEAEDYDRALALFSLCQELDSTSATVNFMLAAYAANSKRKADERRYLYAAYIADPENYGRSYASLQWKDGEALQAITTMENVLKVAKKKETPLWDLIELYPQLGLYVKQMKALKQLEKLTGRTEETVDQWAKLYAKTNMTGKALRTIDKYLESDPTCYSLPITKANIQYMAGDYEESIATLNREIQYHPENIMAYMVLFEVSRLRGNKTQAEDAIVRAMKTDVDYDYKINILQQVLEKKDISDSAYLSVMSGLIRQHPYEADAYIRYANALLTSARVQEAVPVMERLVKIQPENLSANVYLASAYMQLNDTTKLRPLVDSCSRSFPKSLFFNLMQVNHLMESSELDSARHLAEYGVSLQQPDEDNFQPTVFYKHNLYASLAQINKRLERVDAMLEAYRMAVALDSEDKLTLNNYAYELALQNLELDKAERMSRKTIEAEPDNAIYLDTYAWILYLRGEVKMALFYIRKAAEKLDEKRDNSEIYKHLKEIEEANK